MKGLTRCDGCLVIVDCDTLLFLESADYFNTTQELDSDEASGATGVFFIVMAAISLVVILIVLAIRCSRGRPRLCRGREVVIKHPRPRQAVFRPKKGDGVRNELPVAERYTWYLDNEETDMLEVHTPDKQQRATDDGPERNSERGASEASTVVVHSPTNTC